MIDKDSHQSVIDLVCKQVAIQVRDMISPDLSMHTRYAVLRTRTPFKDIPDAFKDEIRPIYASQPANVVDGLLFMTQETLLND